MKISLAPETASALQAQLQTANLRFAKRYPGGFPLRQPVHTVYGGAHLFQNDVCAKLGQKALEALTRFGEPDERLTAKLNAEPVEDYRIDFEDGFGVRTDTEEDEQALRAAGEAGIAFAFRALPPFFGIRVRALDEGCRARSLRTLDLFLTALLDATGGELPTGFVVTLPKVTRPQHCEVFAQALAALERALALPIRSLKFEVMMETPQAISTARDLYDAAEGRCIAAHFGAFDFLSRLGVAAAHQQLDHPFCDAARYALKAAFADTPVCLADGVTALVPNVRSGDPAQVRQAWDRHETDIRRSISQGFYQSWDIHPAQLVSRYRAIHGWFREQLPESLDRWQRFAEAGEKAMQSGGVFDDAATVEGLKVFFRQGIACGALASAEVPPALIDSKS